MAGHDPPGARARGPAASALVRPAAAAGPDTAFTAHARIVAIHPFSDGNGRTARLLMNLLLIRAGYPPIVIGPEHRVAYIDALEALQLGGDARPYDEFMATRLEASLLADHIAQPARHFG